MPTRINVLSSVASNRGGVHHMRLDTVAPIFADDGHKLADVIADIDRALAALDGLTEAELVEARAWIAECAWPDLDESEIADLTPKQIERGIARHYAGGIEAFRLSL